MKEYLYSSEMIDWQEPSIIAKATELAQGAQSKLETARRCFEFVRDDIQHSWDALKNPVTCAASEVLRHGTGYCYAKSHLLAALLRANGIPAGLCYQRTTVAEDSPPFCLHGLNAVYLDDFGWYKLDARGNKPGVDAQFCPPVERLAFAIKTQGEKHFDEILCEPHPLIIELLTRYKTVLDVAANLPDATHL
ncbi:MAG: transglutaminase family protein [Pseudohongiellaceae bacterium]|nr:transglutaminase family protein [Pseudohongiellaceae bacterium]